MPVTNDDDDEGLPAARAGPCASVWEPYGIAARHEARSGRRGRQRSAIRPPTIVPAPKALTSTDHVQAPPR